MSAKMDSLDLKIIQQLQKDARASISSISEKVGSSRPTVTARLGRLFDQGLMIVTGGLNLRQLGFKMAWVGLEVKNDDTRMEVEQLLKGCPRVMNIFRTPEKANIQITVWGEDERTMESTIESFRDIPNVEIVHTHYLGTPIHGDLTINLQRSEESLAPCGKVCTDCHRYKSAFCTGCPVTINYKNPIVHATR